MTIGALSCKTAPLYGGALFAIRAVVIWFYERKGEHWQAFNELAACLICANRIEAVREEGRIAA